MKPPVKGKKPDKLTPGDNIDAMKAKMAAKGKAPAGMTAMAAKMKGKMAQPYGKMPPPPPAHK